MRNLFLIAAVSVVLAGCSCSASPEQKAAEAKAARSAQIRMATMQVGGQPVRCLPMDSLNVNLNTSNNMAVELQGEVRKRFLTQAADQAGVRVFAADKDISAYGSTVLYYLNEQQDCLLWTESMSIQEFAEKAGLNPLGIAQGYEPAKANDKATATK
jgi:hypothetical protein